MVKDTRAVVSAQPKRELLDVSIYIDGAPSGVHGYCAKEDLLITEKFISVTWVDGGVTFLPTSKVTYLHYTPFPTH